jgi:tetratricopeptide (TPR) repeat protein
MAATDARTAGRLPLPIAALALEARNRMQREPTRAHLCAYFAWEASVRLAVAAEPPANVASLAMPSVGDLVHALPASTASSTNRALLDVAVLLAGSGGPKSTTRSRVLEFLPKYRNEHFHGGISRVDEDARAARLLLAGIEAAWEEGLFWAPANALVYVDAVEIDSFGRRRAHVFVLEGLASQAELPDDSLHSVEANVLPGRVYLRAEARYRSLHPWLVYDDGRVLFFNGMKGRGAKYLDYAKNDHVPSKSLLGRLPQLDADLTGLFGARAEPRSAATSEAAGRADAAGSPEAVATPETAEERSDAAAPATIRSGGRRTGGAPWRIGAMAMVAALGIAGVVGLATRHGSGSGTTPLDAAPSASTVAAAAPLPAGELDVPVVSSRPQVQAAFRRAVDELLAADIESSERAFRQVALDEPDQPWPHSGLAMTYGIEHRFDEAYAEQQKAFELAKRGKGDPRDQTLVELLHDADQPSFPGGYAEYRARNPGYFLGLELLAYYASQLGPRDDRIARADAALAVDDRHPLAYLVKVWACLSVGDRQAARKALDQGIALQASAPWLLDQRGVLRMADGDVPGAQQDFLVAMSNHGPSEAAVHYIMALLRSGAAHDAVAKQVDAMLASYTTVDANLRAGAACQVVMAMVARGKVHDADALLHAVLDEHPGTPSAKAGTVARCLLPPLWADDGLGRLGDKEARWRLDSLRALFHKAQMIKDNIEDLQQYDTTFHGLAAAETGHLQEARDELAALQQDPSKEALYPQLVAELSARIALVSGQPVTVPDPDPGARLALRARVAHLQGRVAERDHDDPGASKAYGVLLAMVPECARSDAVVTLPCAAYIADGLARLAALQAKHAQPEDQARTVAAYDALWPNPDADLGPAKAMRALRRAHP